jgi:hypothetical protein
MGAIDQPIRSVTPLSVANFAAAYNAFAGWVVILLHVVRDGEGFKVHLDFPFPFLNPYLDFHVSTSENPFKLILKIVAFTCLFAIAGWLIGLVWAVAYNITSKYLGLRLKGTVDVQESSHTSNQ